MKLRGRWFDILKNLKGTWHRAKVLVIGDIMLDKWVYHIKTRLSPEAPVPVIKESHSQIELGGAGNALRHLNYLSTQDHELLTVLGSDQAGVALRSIPKSPKSKIHWVVDKSRKTTVKERFFLNDNLIFRKDSEEVEDISAQIEAEMMDVLKEIIHNFNVVLLSDYAKGVLTASFVEQIRELTLNLSIPIVVDPGFGRVHIYSGCKIIKPNLIEWKNYIHSAGSEKKGLELLFARGTQFLLITQGDQGIRLVGQNEDISNIPKEKVDVIDVTGAGDSLAAALSLLIGENLSLLESMEILNAVGANTVQHERTTLSVRD